MSHNPEVAGSNPAPATEKALLMRGFSFRRDRPTRKLLPNFWLRAGARQSVSHQSGVFREHLGRKYAGPAGNLDSRPLLVSTVDPLAEEREDRCFGGRDHL